jgi:hypothetical protein
MTATLTPRERELATCALETPRQHDDHCWIMFGGVQRWIIGMRGDRFVTTSEQGLAIIDLSGVDWETYDFVALEMLRSAFPDSSLGRRAEFSAGGYCNG